MHHGYASGNTLVNAMGRLWSKGERPICAAIRQGDEYSDIQPQDSTIDWMKYAVIAAGGLTISLGCIVLIGWYTQSTTLVQVWPEFVPMQYNTALGFVLCGAGLVALVYRRLRLVLLFGGLSAGLAVLTLLQYVAGFDLGIDRLFLEPAITVKSTHPGRMSQITAFSYLLYGIGLVVASGVVRLKRFDLLSGLLGTTVIAIGAGILFGYLLGKDTPYGWSHLTYMAVHTATGFVLLGAGLLIFAVRISTVKERWPNWISVAVGIGVATLAVALWQALLAQERLTNAQTLASQAVHLKTEIEVDITNQILALDRMTRRWERQGGTPKALWTADAARYLQDHPGYQAIEWVDSSMHVRWIEPLAGNEKAMGLDITLEDRRRTMAELASIQGGIRVSRIIDLVQGGKGFLVYSPLYIGKENHLDGFMVGVFHLQSLLEPVISTAISEGYNLELFEGDKQIYSNKKSGPADESYRVREQKIKIYNINWRLRLWPGQGLLAASHSLLPAISLMMGLALALLLGLAVNRVQMAWQRAKAEISARKQAQQAQQETLARFEAVIENTPMVAIQGFDCNGVILSWNFASETLYGFSAEKALGNHLQDVLLKGEAVEEFEGVLEEVFRSGEATVPEEWPVRTRSGEQRWVYSSMFPVFEHGEVAEVYCMDVDITERKKAEKALEESELWMRGVFNAMEEGVVVATPDRKIDNMNPATQAILGYSQQEVIGQLTEMLHVDRAHYVEFGKRIKAAFDQGKAAHFEFKLKRKNGEVFPSEHTVSLLKNNAGEAIGIVSTLRDITERKQVEQVLHKQAMIIDQIHDAVISINLDAVVTSWNKGAERVFGYSDEEAIGRSIAFVYPDDEYENLENEFMEKLEKKGVHNTEVTMMKKNGEMFHAYLSLSMQKDSSGEEIGMISYVLDISDRIRAEGALKKSLAEKEVLLKELHHRVKNILQIISSLINMQARKVRSKPAREAFLETRDRIRAVALIYEKLFGESNLSEIDVKQYIRYIAGRLDTVYEAGKRGIITEISGDPMILDMEKALPCGLIANELLTNIYKHAFPDGGPGHARIELSIDDRTGYSITVKDDGIGINEKKKTGGSFGMEIMATLAGQIGGKLDIFGNIPGEQGTTARLTFTI